MERRRFLSSLGASAAAALAGLSRARPGEAAEPAAGWRTFEVTTRLEIIEPSGITRACVPLPLVSDTDYQKRLGDTWKGNAVDLREWRDARYGVGALCARWPDAEKAPVVEVVSRVSTRDRAVDVSESAARPAAEDPRTLKACLEPTKLLPVDGIVLQTSREITRGRRTDGEKARAIYEWIVENTFRDPKVRGCGLGDIKTMLETRNLGGKCADLNALFVGLARAAGVPAREVFGLRVAESKEFKSLGRAGDVSKAQHCRAEFHDQGRGWVPVDPADVRKVVLEEPPTGRALDDPVVQKARSKLFGAWEMNYVVYNYAHDLSLPGASAGPIPFLMYPQCETGGGRKDSLEPATFKYQITAREVI
ncbi:MAG: transglutaminase [Acidobacteria bacterium]|nr:MAG: transglutaminase [Acidobacteriota bacterium]